MGKEKILERLITLIRKIKLYVFGFLIVMVIGHLYFYPESWVAFSIRVLSLLNKANIYTITFHQNHGELLINIAASIVGIIAITFSLAIFSIQYAAEKGTTQILREYRQDKIYKRTFITFCIFSLLIFLFATIPYREYFTFFSYALTFLFLIATFFLLWRIFMHTISLVNPIDRIQNIYSGIVKYFRRLAENIGKAINSGEIDIKKEEVFGKKLDTQAKRDFLTSGVFQNVPHILNPVRGSLSQIFDIIREYILRRKYDVTFEGLKAVAFTVGEYFKARKKSVESAGLFNARTDSFLTDVYEQLSALNRISIGLKDSQTAQQNARCFQAIAIQAAEYPSLIEHDSNPTMNMALGYLKMNIQEGIKVGMDDLGLDGIRILRDVEIKVPERLKFTVISIITDVYDLAVEGVVRMKFYLVDEGVSALVQIYHHQLKPYERDCFHIRKTIFEKIKTISNYYLFTNPNISVNCEGLSAAFNILNPKSIPAVFINSIPEITPENFSDDAVNELFHLYNDVGEKAGEKDSFLIHFIIQSIDNIVIQTLNYFGKKQDKEKSEKILEEFIWLLSVYWRIYDKQSKHDPKNYIEVSGMDNLVAIALRAIELGFNKFSESVIQQIVSVISVGLRKEIDEYTVPRLMKHLIKVGIVARKKELSTIADKIIEEVAELNKQFLDNAQPNTPKDYFEKNFKEALHREIWEIYLDFDKRERITAFDSDMLFREMIEEKDIKSYLNEIERKIYNREIEDIQRRSYF